MTAGCQVCRETATRWHTVHGIAAAVLALYSGQIHDGTDAQVERLAAVLSRQGTSLDVQWLRDAKGGAYGRRPITSTDLSPDSFPELAALGTGFTTAIAFRTDHRADPGSRRPRRNSDNVGEFQR